MNTDHSITPNDLCTLFDWQNAKDLFAELKKAKLVSKDEFPANVVRLNSTIRIEPEDRDHVMELMIVLPDKAGCLIFVVYCLVVLNSIEFMCLTLSCAETIWMNHTANVVSFFESD